MYPCTSCMKLLQYKREKADPLSADFCCCCISLEIVILVFMQCSLGSIMKQSNMQLILKTVMFLALGDHSCPCQGTRHSACKAGGMPGEGSCSETGAGGVLTVPWGAWKSAFLRVASSSLTYSPMLMNRGNLQCGLGRFLRELGFFWECFVLSWQLFLNPEQNFPFSHVSQDFRKI